MYYLLPFTHNILNGHEIITNDLGNFLVLPRGSVSKIVNRQIESDSALYKDLLSSYIISEQPVPHTLDVMSTRLATRKAFLDGFTSLHIFVVTLRCNQNCIYCQASSRDCSQAHSDMTSEDMKRAIDLMFKSPSKSLTMEFQGGEPTLVPDLIIEGILYAEEKNSKEKRHITYVICSNCVNVSDELLEFCKNRNVVFSSSLDGPEFLHNKNRGKSDSYQKVTAGFEKVRNALGKEKVSALMTTSMNSLAYPREIIDAYRSNGFHSIFLRSLNPYGLAKENNDWDKYFRDFVQFYKDSLEYILEINKDGEIFIEEFTTLILRKMLTPFPIGFVDLQTPAGIINGVIVYNYDGFVYASDESRMLAEHGDYTFQLGRICDKYEDLFYGKRAQELSKIWATEYIAGCSDCAFQSICGADPVRNYSTQGDEYGFRPTSNLCKKNKAIIEHIFTLITERRDEVMPIFQKWITRTR